MANILVSGLINIETTVQVDEFPVEYSPVEYPFFSIHATVSGVGFNITKALTRLGHRLSFLSILGQDLAVASVRNEMSAHYIDDKYVLELAAQTARSVIIFDKEGRQKILVDLKDYQNKTYPYDIAEKVMMHSDMAVLCNINFTRPMLALAKQIGKPIATDVHAISDIDDDYNREYMEMADILFMSHELLPVPPQEFAKEVIARYQPEILVIGKGREGALLAVREDQGCKEYETIETRPVVSTSGAGDALFSCFIHNYIHTKDPYSSMQKAMVFASYKVGVRSASEGFLSSQRLNQMVQEIYA